MFCNDIIHIQHVCACTCMHVCSTWWMHNRIIFLIDIAVYTVFAFFKHKNIENPLITFQEMIFGPLCQQGYPVHSVVSN